VLPAILCEGVDHLNDQVVAPPMAKAALSQILIGPFGLHAFCAVLLVLFVGFLWLFNFTAFF
jgi:hypothetical protein